MDQSFEATLVRQCAPTLAGLKPGSLFCARSPGPGAARRAAEHWDGRLRPLGLGVGLLLERPGAGPALVYVYRPAHLGRVLALAGRRRFLEGAGYRLGGPEELLDQLEDGVDGVIVPMENEECAAGIVKLLRDPEKMAQLSACCKQRDYPRRKEMEKLYRPMED